MRRNQGDQDMTIDWLSASTTFVAQYLMVFSLGFQSQSVNRGHYKLAAANSLLLGTLGYHLTAVIAQVGSQGMGNIVWWGYILAGPAGIVSSMRVHDWMRRRKAAQSPQKPSVRS